MTSEKIIPFIIVDCENVRVMLKVIQLGKVLNFPGEVDGYKIILHLLLTLRSTISIHTHNHEKANS